MAIEFTPLENGQERWNKNKMQEWKFYLLFSQRIYFLEKLFAGWQSVDKCQIPTEATAVMLPHNRHLYRLIILHTTAFNCCCKEFCPVYFDCENFIDNYFKKCTGI